MKAIVLKKLLLFLILYAGMVLTPTSWSVLITAPDLAAPTVDTPIDNEALALT